jgi:hypothetical protein
VEVGGNGSSSVNLLDLTGHIHFVRFAHTRFGNFGENSAGEIVGIEVKSAASVTRRDFLGLERVASAAGSAFKQGIVFGVMGLMGG